MKLLLRIALGIVAALGVIALAFWLWPVTLHRAYSLTQQDNHAAPPVEIAQGVYYVGASDIAAYLIDTGEGLILIDGGYAETAPIILDNIRALGFAPSDVRILLNTHAHFDHAAGLAALKQATGAQLYASPEDAALLRAGGRGDFFLRDFFRYTPVSADHELRDGEAVTLGAVTLTAHFMPGHTKGCTSWTFPATMRDGAVRQTLVICSLSTLRYDLVGNADYPEIAADYARTYEALNALPCEIFLGAHGRWFDLPAVRTRVAAGDHNAFVQPQACRAFLAESQGAYEAEFARQRAR
ncbi:MAG TPA: subclass B3 metallo-beta-lactamase [Terricaulis sp.]|nr:subclass B3 metallo-beta-lactamase [Terricaulis sp.]